MSEPQKGDKLTISINGETPVVYEISDSKPGLVYIHKPGESHKLSALMYDGIKWNIYGLPSNLNISIVPQGTWLLENIGKYEKIAQLSNKDIFDKSMEDRFYDESVWKRLSKEKLTEFIKYKGRNELGKFAGEDSGPAWKTFYYLMSKLKSIKDSKNKAEITNTLKTLSQYVVKEPFVVIFTDPDYKKFIPEALKELVRAGNLDVLKYILMTNNVPLAQYNSQLVDVVLTSPSSYPELIAYLLQNGLYFVQSDIDSFAQKNNIPVLDMFATYDVYPSLKVLKTAYNTDDDELLVILASKYGANGVFDPDLYDEALSKGKVHVEKFFEEYMN